MMLDISLDRVILISLIFVRISAIFMTAPFFNNPSIPIKVRLSLCLLLTFIFFPLAGEQRELGSLDQFGLALAAAKEVLLGAAIGFTANLVFAGINLAAQVMGFQMGFGIVNVLDPINQAQVSIIAQFLGFASLVLFVSLNGHYWFIEAISWSFGVVGMGTPNLSGLAVENIMSAAGELFVIALKIGAPVFAVLLFTNVGLGIVARTVPQMNVFIVGFPLTIGVGLLVIGITIPLFFHVIKGLFNGMGRDIAFFLKVV